MWYRCYFCLFSFVSFFDNLRADENCSDVNANLALVLVSPIVIGMEKLSYGFADSIIWLLQYEGATVYYCLVEVDYFYSKISRFHLADENFTLPWSLQLATTHSLPCVAEELRNVEEDFRQQELVNPSENNVVILVTHTLDDCEGEGVVAEALEYLEHRGIRSFILNYKEYDGREARRKYVDSSGKFDIIRWFMNRICEPGKALMTVKPLTDEELTAESRRDRMNRFYAFCLAAVASAVVFGIVAICYFHRKAKRIERVDFPFENYHGIYMNEFRVCHM